MAETKPANKKKALALTFWLKPGNPAVIRDFFGDGTIISSFGLTQSRNSEGLFGDGKNISSFGLNQKNQKFKAV